MSEIKSDCVCKNLKCELWGKCTECRERHASHGGVPHCEPQPEGHAHHRGPGGPGHHGRPGGSPNWSKPE